MTSYTRFEHDPRPSPPAAAPPAHPADLVMALEDEIGHLKHAVVSHAAVDQAIGVIIALGRLTPEQGWHVLREVSQHTNIKLREVADRVVEWAGSGALPCDVRRELDRALRRRRPGSTARGR